MGWYNAGGWGGRGWSKSANSLDAATTAWVAAVVAAGGPTPSTTQQGHVDTLIKSLRNHSLWAKLDRLWLYASEDEFQAKVDLVANVGHIKNGTPTFTASQGYTAGGSGYLDTMSNMVSVAGNYTTQSACYGFYVRSAMDASSPLIQMGCRDTANTHVASFQNTGGDGNAYGRINEGFGSSATTSTASYGLVVMTRTGHTASKLYFYLASGATSYSRADADTGSPPNCNFYVMAVNDASSGTPTASAICGLGQFSIAFLGGGLTDSDASNLSTDLNAYMTSLGTNVY